VDSGGPRYVIRVGRPRRRLSSRAARRSRGRHRRRSSGSRMWGGRACESAVARPGEPTCSRRRTRCKSSPRRMRRPCFRAASSSHRRRPA